MLGLASMISGGLPAWRAAEILATCWAARTSYSTSTLFFLPHSTNGSPIALLETSFQAALNQAVILIVWVDPGAACAAGWAAAAGALVAAGWAAGAAGLAASVGLASAGFAGVDGC